MAEGKTRLGFDLDVKDMQKQLDAVIKKLLGVKEKSEKAGQAGTSAFKSMEAVIKSTQKTVAALSSRIDRSLKRSAKASETTLKAATAKIQVAETRIQDIRAATNIKIQKLEDAKIKMAERTAKRRIQLEASKERAAAKSAAKEKAVLVALQRSRAKATKDELNRQRLADVQRLQSIDKRKKAEERLTKSIQKEAQMRATALNLIKAAVYLKIATSIAEVTKEATILAAQNEVLGTAMRVVGTNMGFTIGELEAAEARMRDLGISIKDARITISRFAQANLTMADTINISRAAQDLAAGSTLGSSEALEIMTKAIISMFPRQLRQFGIMVNLNNVYRDQAALLGKTVPALTDLEKRQALMNIVLSEAGKRAGAYERSMQDVGKILTSLSSRIVPDTLSAFGDFLLPIFSKLVFIFKDALEGLQGLSGGWKALIVVLTSAVAASAAVTAAVLGFVAALKMLQVHGMLMMVALESFAKVGGIAAIAVAALTATVVAASAAWQLLEAAEREEFEQAKKSVLLANERVDTSKRLIDIVEDETVTQKELTRVLRDASRKNKELLPFLKQEKIDREALIKVLNKHKKALEETSKIAQDNARKASQLVIAALIREKEAIQAVIDAKILFNKEGTRQERIENQTGEAMDRLLIKRKALIDTLSAVGQIRLFSARLDDIKTLENRFVELSRQIDSLADSHKKGFGTISDSALKSARDVAVATGRVGKAIDKIGARTVKKRPFEALNKLYKDTLEVIKSTGAGSITQLELTKKLEANINAERTRLLIKYNKDVAKLGASRIQIAEANARVEMEKVRGGKEAEVAIAKKFAVEVNKIHAETWEKSISIIQDATDKLKQAYEEQKDMAIGVVKEQMGLELAQRNLTEEQKVDIRKKAFDEILKIEDEFNSKQLEAQEEVFVLRKEQLEAALDNNVVSEETYTGRVKELAADRRDFLAEQDKRRIASLKQAIDASIAEEIRLTNKLRELEDERKGIVKSGEDVERGLRQKTQTDLENHLENRRLVEIKMSDARTALREGDFELAKRLTQESIQLSKSLAQEVIDNTGKEKEVVVSKNDAVRESIGQVREATSLLLEINMKMKDDTVAAIDDIRSNIKDWREDLEKLTKDPHEITIEVKGNALADIESIRGSVEALTSKPYFLDIIVRKLKGAGGTATTGDSEVTGGESVGGATGGATPGLAGGAVDFRGRNETDIPGPGTSTSDSILARLSKGESVLSAATTDMFKPLIQMMHQQPGMLRDLLRRVPGQAPSTGAPATFGDISINIAGVRDISGFAELNWREIVRNQISGELRLIAKRKNQQRL